MEYDGGQHPEFELEQERFMHARRAFAREHDELLEQEMPEHVAADLRDMPQGLAQASVQPYFGRIDFTEGAVDHHTVYVGRQPLLLDSLVTVITWTSPTAELYYDGAADNGSAGTAGSHGRTLVLRRVIDSDDGVVTNVTDTFDRRSGRADADQEHVPEAQPARETHLQRRAATRSGASLQQFVDSITPEQYAALRTSADKHVIITGPAGSGKSSVAFHRLALLAAEDNGTAVRVDPARTLILSPSQRFRDFAGPLLAELGVSAARIAVLDEWILGFVGGGQDETAPRIVDDATRSLVEGSLNAERIAAMTVSGAFHGSMEFAGVLDRIAEEVWASLTRGLDRIEVEVPGITRRKPLQVDVQDLAARASDDKDMPLARRRELLVDLAVSRVELELRQSHRVEGRIPSVRPEVQRKLNMSRPLPRALDLMHAFWTGSRARRSKTDEADRTLDLTDLAAIHYLQLRLSGPGSLEYDHIIVDEAQELNPLQLRALLSHVPRGNVTLVGDPAQTITVHRSMRSWEPVHASVDRALDTIQLDRTYRSTREIASVARHLRAFVDPSSQLTSGVERAGVPCRLVIAKNREGALQHARSAALRLSGRVRGKIGLLVRRQSDVEQFRRMLQQEASSDIEVMRVDQARGIEFAGVVVFDASHTTYALGSEIDARVLHVAATRALHELTFVAIEKPTALLDGLPRDVLVA